MHRFLAFILAVGMLPVTAAEPDSEGPNTVVQGLFHAMSAHDAESARLLFTPDAMLFSVSSDGAAMAIPHEKWLAKWAASKDAWLERTWNLKLLQHGSIAVVWADYDFHLNGKLSHCGIDSFNLLKTSAGWKIAAIADTRETSGCLPSPLGPPAN